MLLKVITLAVVGMASAQAPAPAPAPAPAAPQYEPFPCDDMRREWRTLTPGQQQTYIAAVNTLMQSQQYANWLQIHTNPAIDRYGHSSDGFFPWHRYYILQYENQLRSLGGPFSCISLPYWDWSADSATYGANIQGSPNFAAFGGPSNGLCVEQLVSPITRTVPFPSFAMFRYPNDAMGRFRGGCVRRQMTAQRIPTHVELADILTRNRLYLQDPRFRVGFRYAVSGAHNAIHNMIGGSMGATDSCYDPIFMMHHSFIDKLWATWQSCHGLNNFPAVFSDDAQPTQFSAQNAMPGFPTGVSPMMVVDINNIMGRRYSYAPSALEGTPQWQGARAAGICSAPVTARTLGAIQVNVTLSQRELDGLEIYATTARELAKTTNDTAIISYMATRKSCEKMGVMGNYTEPSKWATTMGSTATELLSYMNSPCVEVNMGEDTEAALAKAKAFDAKHAETMKAKLDEMVKNDPTARLLPNPADYYPGSKN